jgi:hypothetical protein
MPVTEAHMSNPARRLAATIEPVVGQVYFSPECHERYTALGFKPSPGHAGRVALPDGPAYFTSRGSVMGQVPGELIASAFAVFNPEAVVPSVSYGWSITDARTICAARDEGAIAQLRRVLGDEPEGLARVTELLVRVSDQLRVEGRPLYAGLRSLEWPDHPVGRMWRAGDMLREYRGDCHTAAWTSAGLDAVEIGLLSELWYGLSLKTYVRTRAWSDEQLDAGIERLEARGWVADGKFTEDGWSARAAIESTTDLGLVKPLHAIGDDIDELCDRLAVWGAALREAGAYLSAGPADLARR